MIEHYLTQASYDYFLAHEADEWTYGWLEADGSRTSPREPGQPFLACWCRHPAGNCPIHKSVLIW